MELTRVIYSTTLSAISSPEEIKTQAKTVVETCELLELTGRYFRIEADSLVIREGPTDAIETYFEAAQRDTRMTFNVLIYKASIKTRQFNDFSMWVGNSRGLDLGPHVNILTEESLNDALPLTLSPALRILLQSNLPDALFA